MPDLNRYRLLVVRVAVMIALFCGKRIAGEEAGVVAPHHSVEASDDEAGLRYDLYGDKVEGDYIPSGWMPDGRGLGQELACTDTPHSGKHCLRSEYRLSENSWVGIGWELDGVWTPKRKLNLYDKLKAGRGDRVILRFWARSKEGASVKFTVGGGKGDSIQKVVTTDPEWIKLGAEWTRYEIDLKDSDLSSVVQAFAYFLERGRNSRPDVTSVTWDLDDIRFVKLRTSEPAAERRDPPEGFRENVDKFHKKLESLRWIDYSPSTFNPASDKPLSPDDIAADLRALAEHGLDPAHSGICTYGCSPRFGMDRVPEIARHFKFSGVILGVWSIEERSEEINVAKRLAKEGLVDAICMGNEGLFFSRYSRSQLQVAVRDMRVSTGLPVSTSEVIDSYSARLLTDEREMDWVYPNVHPVFHNYSDPQEATEWVCEIINKLDDRTKLPILVHETGWPSQGLTHHNPERQREFWEGILRSGHHFALFEAFDQPWKHEKYRNVDIGTSWGWFTADRRPKPVVQILAGWSPLQKVGKHRSTVAPQKKSQVVD